MPMGAGIQIPEEGPVWMKVSVDYEKAWFSYSLDGTHFETVDHQGRRHDSVR